jgi:hypothetical protein
MFFLDVLLSSDAQFIPYRGNSKENSDIVYISLSQSFYPGGTLEIIFRSRGTPA